MDTQAFMQSGTAYFKAKKYDAAIADFTAVIRDNPKNAVARYNRGCAWYGKGDRDLALADWETAARLAPGNVKYREMAQKARMAAGMTAERNREIKSAEQYWYAAEHGSAQAQYNLGCCFYEGNGAEQDIGKAVYWYTKAAEQGHTGAQYNLGYCYYEMADDSQAVYWWTKAAEQGDTDARNNLAFYYGEDGVEYKETAPEKKIAVYERTDSKQVNRVIPFVVIAAVFALAALIGGFYQKEKSAPASYETQSTVNQRMMVTRDERRLPWRSDLGRYERLALRSEPGGKKVLTQMERGEVVTVLETGKSTQDSDGYGGNWLKVRYRGITGWCFSAYLDPVE